MTHALTHTPPTARRVALACYSRQASSVLSTGHYCTQAAPGRLQAAAAKKAQGALDELKAAPSRAAGSAKDAITGVQAQARGEVDRLREARDAMLNARK